MPPNDREPGLPVVSPLQSIRRAIADALRPDPVALRGDGRMIGVRVVAAHDVEPLGLRGPVGLHIVARVEVEAVAQRVLVLGVGEADLGTPSICGPVDRLDLLGGALQPADQQTDTLVRVGFLGMLLDLALSCFGKCNHNCLQV